MNNIKLRDDLHRFAKGEIEFEIRDRNGHLIDRIVEPNIVKIFSKEILSHRMFHSKVWDSTAGTGSGAWVSNPEFDEDFAAKYILFGAAFDDDGAPLGQEDTRFYSQDPVTGSFIPNRLTPGATDDGDLINPIPIAEPGRPLKRIENVLFEPTYQPAGTPLLQDDVRAMNNIVLLETVLPVEEYNGFGTTSSDFFNITEVGLAAGKELGLVSACECTPRTLFLDGGADDTGLVVTLSGGDVVSIDTSESEIDLVKEGDQIFLAGADSTDKTFSTLDQVSAFYLVVEKSATGRDIRLDRVPVDSDNFPLTGQAKVFKDTLRLFSHRILQTPVKKFSDVEIRVRWRIIFN